MTSPQTVSVRFDGGPLAGRLAELTKKPAPIVRVESSPEGAYVLDMTGRGYGWHVPDPDPPAAQDEDEPVAQHRPRTRRR